MSIQRDYILRMIEMMGKLIAAILGRVAGGKLDEAEEMLENAYHDLLREDAAFFRGIPAEQLTHKLLSEHHYTNGHLEILAELFFAEAELQYARENREESLVYYEKCVRLFRFIETESRTLSFERSAKIQSVEDRIAELKG